MSHAVSHAIEDVPKPKPTGPCVMVIFGATGDLTSRQPRHAEGAKITRNTSKHAADSYK